MGLGLRGFLGEDGFLAVCSFLVVLTGFRGFFGAAGAVCFFDFIDLMNKL